MCAWRYNAAGAWGTQSNGNGTARDGGPGGAYHIISSAGAHLRDNAVDDSSDRPFDGYASGLLHPVSAQADQPERDGGFTTYRGMGMDTPLGPAGSTPSVAGASPALVSESNHRYPSPPSAVGETFAKEPHRIQSGVAAVDSSMRMSGVDAISRKLFRGADKRNGASHSTVKLLEEPSRLRHLSTTERDFVLRSHRLFREVDDELLSSHFAPHEHVVAIIASEQFAGGEATAAEIAERLGPYYDLEKDVNVFLDEYIKEHHHEFNNAIADCSEMILAVSGSDDTLTQLKQQLVTASVSLETHSEQLQMLRLRAAKSLFMESALKRIQGALSMEAEVKSLLSRRHYLGAVELLLKCEKILNDPDVEQVRATQALREFVENTKANIHTRIIEDLLFYVFRQDKLQEANGKWFARMMANAQADATTSCHTSSTQDILHKYWERVTQAFCLPTSRAKGTGSAGDNEQASGHPVGEGDESLLRPEPTLAGIIEGVYDNPLDEEVTHNCLLFIPMCVKCLMLLRRMDHCHATFFAKTTSHLQRFIAHFIHLYDMWRKKAVAATNLAGSEENATLRVIQLKASTLADDILSVDEAVALVQAKDMRAMLSALFTQLGKVVRNVDYLRRIIMLAHYPFLISELMQATTFHPSRTYTSWGVSRAALPSSHVRHALLQAGAEDVSQQITHGLAADKLDNAAAEKLIALQKILQFIQVEPLWKNHRGTMSPPWRSPVDKAICEGSGNGSPPGSTLSETPTPITVEEVISQIERGAETICKVDAGMAADTVPTVRDALIQSFLNEVRQHFLQSVSDLYQQWSLHVLWSQLRYHVELVFHVLCDAKDAEDEMEDIITLAPFLRQKNLMSRVQRTAANMRNAERQGEDSVSLEKLLNNFASSGYLRLMEECGSVSFSLVGSVTKAQHDLRKAAEERSHASPGESRLPSPAPETSGGGGGGGGIPLTTHQSSVLRRWFVCNAMNLLTCFESATHFYDCCCDSVPELRGDAEEDHTIGFFARSLRMTYLPSIRAFHLREMRRLFMEMGDVDENTLADATIGRKVTAGADADHTGEATGAENAAVWPTVTVLGCQYPVLECVNYVARVAVKVAKLRRRLPDTLFDIVEQSTSEAVVGELAGFLKRKLQLLGRGTIQYRLLNSSFEDAYGSRPHRRWTALCDERHIMKAHEAIDTDLFRYYRFNSDQRTSGHQYARDNHITLEALSALEEDRGDLDERIGTISAKDLCLHGDKSVVALAVMSYSTEWLCGVLAKEVWPMSGLTTLLADSVVPGYRFTQRALAMMSGTSAPLPSGGIPSDSQRRQMSHLSRLFSLSQAALFYLSVEARFAAFLFLPQLRDESYNIVATSASADTFVQAYARRIYNLYTVLRMHLPLQRIKYTCLTIAKPASELVLLELAHLRDKVISEAGLSRLQTNLLVIQTALQQILPTDLDVRAAVNRFFSRQAVFLHYIPNQGVVDELISSGAYRLFSTSEVEVLIRLVFRQVSGLNDDTAAQANIKLFHRKLRSVAASSKNCDNASVKPSLPFAPKIKKLTPHAHKPGPIAVLDGGNDEVRSVAAANSVSATDAAVAHHEQSMLATTLNGDLESASSRCVLVHVPDGAKQPLEHVGPTPQSGGEEEEYEYEYEEAEDDYEDEAGDSDR